MKAQIGLLNYDFSTGNTYNWGAATASSTANVVNGKMVVTLALQSGGKYRADLKQLVSTTVHAGTYPIVAIKFHKPPHCNIFFDTNLGSYNNRNNNQLVMKTLDSNRVFYWDLSKYPLGASNYLSTTSPTTLSFITFKVADIVPTPEQSSSGVYTYDVDWIKTFSSVDALRAATTSPFPMTNFNFTGNFVHPGCLHDSTDLVRMRYFVNTQFGLPYRCYLKFQNSPYAKFTYSMYGPYVSLSRDATKSVLNTATGLYETNIKTRTERDCLAAYYNALMWHITADVRHAQKAKEIINAYANNLVSIVGADAGLNGLQGFVLTNAAELMRSYTGWTSAEQTVFGNTMKNVFYPVLQNFIPCSHSNWDLCAMKCLMAIAIFTEDRTLFNKVGHYFYNGEGNGSLYNHIISPEGQMQESSRDQGHTQGAIGWRGDICEMAWKQGLDLYEANNNALKRGTEYAVNYNLGNTVPFVRHYDYCLTLQTDGSRDTISSISRGNFSPIYEQLYNHYVYRKGVAMPYTFQRLNSLNATDGEDEGSPNSLADHTGYGSFLFYLPTNYATHYFLPVCKSVNCLPVTVVRQ